MSVSIGTRTARSSGCKSPLPSSEFDALAQVLARLHPEAVFFHEKSIPAAKAPDSHPIGLLILQLLFTEYNNFVSRGTAAEAMPPFRLGDPALCGSHPLVTRIVLVYTRGLAVFFICVSFVCVSLYCVAVFCVVCFFWVFFTFAAFFPSVL